MALVRSTGPGFFDVNLMAMAKASLLVIIAGTLALFGSIYLTKVIFGSRRFRYLGLEKTQEKASGYSTASESYQAMVGRQGVSLTKLRPAGKVQIGEQIFDAVARYRFIDKEETIEVVDYQQAQLIVKKKEEHHG